MLGCHFINMPRQNETGSRGLPTSITSQISGQSSLEAPESSRNNSIPVKTQYEVHESFVQDATSTSDTTSPKCPALKTPHSSSSQFQFVNISKPAEMRDFKNKKLVRRSVAFSHRRKQILSQSKDPLLPSGSHMCLHPNFSTQPPVNYCQVCGFSLRKKRGGSSAKSHESEDDYEEKECVENGILGAGRVDPFATFPIASQPYMHLLVDHCKSGTLKFDVRSWNLAAYPHLTFESAEL